MKKIFSCILVLVLLFASQLCVNAEIEIPGHIWSDWTVVKQPTCTEDGSQSRTCTADPDNPHTEVYPIPALGHDYSQKVTGATCTQSGIVTYTCNRCGETYTEQGTEALGHDYSSEITTEPTCTAEGVRTYTCSRCNSTYTESIDPEGHLYSEPDITEPDCQNEGVKTYTCERCGDTYTEVYAPKKEHDFEEKDVQDGFMIDEIGVCRVCGTTIEIGKRTDGLFLADAALSGANILLIVYFALILIPDFYILIWYRRRKKKIAEKRRENESAGGN